MKIIIKKIGLSILLCVLMLVTITCVACDDSDNNSNSTSNTKNENIVGDLKYVYYSPTERTYSVKAANTDISGEVNIPATYNGRPVVNIDAYAFQDCKNITKITIAEGIKSIGQAAFKNCINLKYISIPDSVTRITSADIVRTFHCCTSLESIILPKNLKIIEEGIFNSCTSLKSVTLPENLEEIKKLAFSNCTSLKEIIIPETVKNITYAFDKSLETITFKGSSAQWKSVTGSDKIPSNTTVVFLK